MCSLTGLHYSSLPGLEVVSTTVSHRLGSCDPYRLRPPLPPLLRCTREGGLRRLHYISWTNSLSKNFF